MSARYTEPLPPAAPLSEADTRAKLIDPATHVRGWTENMIRREETAGAIEIVNGKPRKRARGRIDYTLRIAVNPETQPVAVALIEASGWRRTKFQAARSPQGRVGQASQT